MENERHIGGLWCREVLEKLSDFVDGEVTSEVRGSVEAHLAECDTCERFGGEFSDVVRGIRRTLLTSGPSPGARERLRAALDDELNG